MERVWLATVYPVQVGAAGGVYTVARAVLTDLTRAAKRPTWAEVTSGHDYLGSLLLGWELLKCFRNLL